MSTILWLIPIICIVLWLKRLASTSRSKLSLPPGPPADPFIGHLRYIPSENPEDKFSEWSKQYGMYCGFKFATASSWACLAGDVMLLHAFNRKMIILNSVEAAVDLMEKRSSNYSDRPDFPIFQLYALFDSSTLGFILVWYLSHNRMGWGRSLTFSGYGKTFRKHRRLYQQHFSSQKAVQYRHTQLREARRLAFNLYEIGTDKIEPILNRWEIFMFEISFLTHVLDSFSTSIVSAIAYGYEVLSDDDPYLQLARESGYALSHCGPPGGTPVDLFPICTSRSVFAVMYAHDSFYSAAPTILVPRNFFCMESTRIQSYHSTNAKLSVRWSPETDGKLS